jgi:hypothetical protein
MERHILRYSYLVGLVFTAIGVVWRGANQFGWFLMAYVPGAQIGYLTFVKGAALAFMVTIATGIVMQHQTAKS